ncbi:hypothetical protein [Streptomyces adelaidensis]|uniref:hypothetical protein n=1 Tax=Streptomyces adelaidensis TaxID=2796465 RepID=UPI0027DD6891|nr:hypothetical protein [Streptomyces adelaidensis]
MQSPNADGQGGQEDRGEEEEFGRLRIHGEAEDEHAEPDERADQREHPGVLLASADGSGENGTTAKKDVVSFHGKEYDSDGGAAATPRLPAGGVYYDSTLAVTYWQSTVDDALKY